MNRFCLLCPLFALMILFQAGSVFGQFRTLVRHLPDEANTLVLFNVEAILATPLAQKEKWREGHENMFSSGLILVPPQTNQFAMASQMDIELMQPHWNAAVANVTYEPQMLKVTQRYGGNVDTIDGQDAAVLPNDTFVIKFGKAIVGTLYPADRQKATRWVQDVFALSSRKPLGDYLTEAQGYAEKNGTPIIIAMDLQHVVSPSFIRSRLDSMKSLQGKKVDLDQCAKVLGGIRGVTLGITITDRVVGGLKVDFDQDVTALKDVAKGLLLEVLGNHGAMIQEFNDWKVTVSGKAILLRGSLYRSGMQRVFSLLDAPAAFHPIEQQASGSSPGDAKTSQSLVARSTQQYFNTIGLLITDLQGESKKHQTTTPGLVAIWHEKYAKKIDAMPILHVDPEMVQFGVQVSGALRQSENAMRTAGVRKASRIANMQGAQIYNYEYAAGGRAGVGPYGGVGARGGYAYRYQADPRASLRADGQQIAQIQAQETSRGYATANQLMQEITVSMAAMRRKMTLKYNIEF